MTTIETRFNNMDARFNNLDSHLNDIENRLTTLPAQKEPAKQDIMNELKRAEIRDIRIAWYAFMIVGVGLVGAGFAGAGYYWPAFLVGVVVLIIGCCGFLCRWFTPRSE